MDRIWSENYVLLRYFMKVNIYCRRSCEERNHLGLIFRTSKQANLTFRGYHSIPSLMPKPQQQTYMEPPKKRNQISNPQRQQISIVTPPPFLVQKELASLVLPIRAAVHHR